MKNLATIFFLTISLLTFGQTEPKVKRDKLNRIIPFDKFNIDSTNCNNFYEKSINLLAFKNFDSSKKALEIIQSLYQFDETKYSLSKFENYLKQVEIEAECFYKSALTGQWKFEWSGTNWGTDETSKSIVKKISFQENVITFYEKDSIVRQTKYKLEKRFKSTHLSTYITNYLIVFLDNNQEWSFEVYNNSSSFVPYLGKTKNMAILFNQMINCSCGCPNEIYEKENTL